MPKPAKPHIRNCHPDQRRQLKRDVGVPGRSLQAAASKMMRPKSPHRNNIETNPKKMKTVFGASRTVPGAKFGAVVDEDPSDRDASARMALEATQRRQEYEARRAIAESARDGDDPMPNMCLRKYFQDFQKVVETSDVLLEVLDARDPTACRLKLAEDMIRSKYNARKQIVLILNKMDLVPLDIALEWLEYLREQGENVVAFSTNTRGGSTETGDLTRRCVDNVFKVLRGFTRTDTGHHKSITVGVIGYPNVGKSSVINALKRKEVVGVANQAGSTKGPAEVELRQNVTIMDSPGVVFDNAQTRADLVLINAVKVADVADPIGVVRRIVDKVGLPRLQDHYGLPHCSDMDDFIRRLAIKKGKLLSGGVTDEENTARGILRDWNDATIAFYTQPPKMVGRSWDPSVQHDDMVALGHATLQTDLDVGLHRGGGNATYSISDTIPAQRVKMMKRQRDLQPQTSDVVEDDQ
eukprot:PhM_4_TR3322/c0_g1_i1/m.27723/K14538/NUG1, GNL3; nuclear GTP-binding protein